MTEFRQFGLGTYQLTGSQCAESVATALDAGYRLIDTAQEYQNEGLVRRGIDRSNVEKEDVFVATKLSTDNLAYDDVIDTAHESAARLAVETIDLLYVHWPLNTYDPDDTIGALNQLHTEGLVDRIGLSNFRPDQLDAARRRLVAPLFAHQVECHPLLQQRELREYAREHNHWLVAYSPLARGAVSEVEVLQDIGAAHGTTPYQVALAWLLAMDSVAVIPKATSPTHIKANVEALEMELTEAEIARIDSIERRDRKVDFDSAPWHQDAEA